MNQITLDEAPLNSFHKRVVAFTTGGMFCDGYILGMIGYAMVLLGPQMNLSPFWYGMIGSSALIGIFIGSLLCGWLTDRIGRKLAFTIDLILMLVLSISQFFVTDPTQLFIVRLLLGIAIGAEYAIGAALMAEFLPKKQRGSLLACLNAVWTLGFVVSVIVGYFMLKMGGENIWRWMLASSSIPAFIVLILRWGVPESPRWLINKGRREEAEKIVKKYIGTNVVIDDLVIEENIKTSYLELFSKKYLKRTIFCSVFWFCQITPFFAIITFAPQILKTFNLSDDGLTGTLILNLFQLAGVIFGVWIMDKVSRRYFMIISFAILIPSLFILGIVPNPGTFILILCFAVFLFVVTAAGNLEYVYPSELFPTHIRSTGVGFASAMSRTGAAVGTLLLPMGIERYGIGVTLLIGSGVLVIGFITSVLLAPETRGLSLNEASLVLDQPANNKM
ncbi:MFS transporter [Neobacillus kokaensis]|uniref:MFS transporter n=1 Tax=Neobacillus kokaensis TaxID=2759023 RepID=A0ABQ3N7Q8_9BACI|nr:MFS transporter [Neobacillus kokaensis]GHI00980.1 MFS transporter [Neobacillus kokaensis]